MGSSSNNALINIHVDYSRQQAIIRSRQLQMYSQTQANIISKSISISNFNSISSVMIVERQIYDNEIPGQPTSSNEIQHGHGHKSKYSLLLLQLLLI